jgi:hypothetical protein
MGDVIRFNELLRQRAQNTSGTKPDAPDNRAARLFEAALSTANPAAAMKLKLQRQHSGRIGK